MVKKFRVWDKVNNCYLGSDKDQYLSNNGDIYIFDKIIYPYDLIWLGSEHYDVELFTGFLTDKNKEIYEGDIIEAISFGEKLNAPVLFKKGMFGVFTESKKSDRAEDDCFTSLNFFIEYGMIKIIGNVHQGENKDVS